jgi:spermidine/putrescine transport system permease protein
MGRLPVLWPVVLAAFLAFLLLPLVIVVAFSFAENPVTRLPLEGLTLRWYAAIAESPEFWSALSNSLLIGVPTALVAGFTGTLAAFGLAGKRPDRTLSYLSALSLPVMLPPLVVAIGLVVLFVRWLSLPLGLPAVIAGHVLLTQPFVALIVAARLVTFDRTAVDAARDLGATRWQAFRLVTWPQARTAVVGAALIAFAVSLDEFIVTLFTIGSGNTLSTFVWGRMRTALDPTINAIATVVLVLTIGTVTLALWSARRSRSGHRRRVDTRS